jgi:hypothetical protein
MSRHHVINRLGGLAMSETNDEPIRATAMRRRRQSGAMWLVLVVSAGVLTWWLWPLVRPTGLCTADAVIATDPLTGELVVGNCCMDGKYLDLLDRYPDWMVVAVYGPQEEDGPQTKEQLALLCP